MTGHVLYRGSRDELNEMCRQKDERIAELEAQISAIHASGQRFEFSHEWYLDGVRRAPGAFVLMRIGDADEREQLF